jgi:hypothetical protein
MLQKRQFHIQLKTQETNNKLTQKLVQGSSDTELVCSFDQDGKIIKIADTAKISLAVIYNGNTANYHLEPGDQDYGIVINSADGTVTIPFTEMLTTAFGVNKLFLKIDDTNISYAIGLEYEVIKNDAYNPQSTPNNLPSYKKLEKELDLKLNKDFSNSDDVALKAKLSSIGVSEDDTPEQLRDKLQTLKADNRLDNSAVKNSLSNDLADVDLDKFDEKFQATDSGKILQQNSQAISTKASKDLSDVDTMDLENAFEKTPSHTTLVDTARDLGNKAETNLNNVLTSDLSEKIKLTNAYKDMAGRTGGGLTPDEIRALFEANYFEETAAVDLTQAPFTATTLVLAYQFNTDNETITQALPPISQNKTLMIKVLPATGITNPTLILTPASSDHINGAAQPLTIKNTGYVGYLLPIANNSNWEFYPHETTHDFSLALSDDKGNVHIGINSIEFEKTTVTEENGILKVKPDAQTGGNSDITFTDFEGRTFTSNKIQSLDKSLRISNLGGIADFSRGLQEHNEGIHACLGNDQLINSKYGRAKLYFGDIRVKGGSFVYTNMQDKSFVVDDVDPQDDPNISGGTTFIAAIYYEPNLRTDNTVSQDGFIRLELVDDTDTPLTDNNGQPMATQIDYKAGDVIKPELYVGEFQAKAFTNVHLRIELGFPSDEVIPVGANTQICLQAITKDESSGLALLSFMAFTGFRIGFDTVYYGFNSLNLAQFLLFQEAETEITGEMELGDNTFLNLATSCKVAVDNYHLIIKDNSKDLPVWDIMKFYDEFDSRNISGKNIAIKATLTDKDNAFDVSLLEYTGSVMPIPKPHVLSYNNGTPVFTAGWSVADNMFISEDVVSGEHTQTKTFTIPDNPKGIAVIMYQHISQMPSTLQLKDLEADITPWFNRVMITDNSHISEQYLRNLDYVYRSIVAVPAGYASYRYTVNSAKTKLPVGVFSGGDNKIVNDNSWTDAGSTDPNKTQGDIKFLADGIVTINYQAQCYNEQGTINNVEFWLEKVSDSSEVAGSHYATTIEAQRTTPKNITSPKFTFSVKANETYRFYGKSNKDDGFYLQTSTVANPLIRFDYEFEELSEVTKLALDDAFSKTNEIKFVKADGEEVTNKILVYNVDDGKFKLEDKA